MKKTDKIVVFWEGLPACGLLLNSIARDSSVQLTVFATRAAVPFRELDKMLAYEVIYLDKAAQILDYQSHFDNCDAFVFTGWRHREILELGIKLRKRYKTKLVMAVDNRRKHNIRQFLGAIYFRIFYRDKLDYAFVPGKSASQLMRFFGLRQDQIKLGYYGASSELYWSDRAWKDRQDEFLFVGSIDRRKGVDLLLDGFKNYRQQGGLWKLRMVGAGPLRDVYDDLDGVIWEGFRQPHDVAERMRKAKVLFLTSRDDHWGTVVCEAAACGMLLAVSASSGAYEDIIMEGVNGISIKKVDCQKLSSIMWQFEKRQHSTAEYGSSISQLISRKFGELAYQNALRSIIGDDSL